MTRKELIESDEYVTASVDCMVRSNVGIRVVRRDVSVNWIKHKDELIEMYKKENGDNIETFIKQIFQFIGYGEYSVENITIGEIQDVLTQWKSKK